MSQTRRRMSSGVEAGLRGPARAAGDAAGAAATNPPPTRPRERSKSKNANRVPKSMRYELENALLSLADVWFEDIKPYLIRNNIKLHVHPAAAASCGAGADGGAAGAAGGSTAPAAGDQPRTQTCQHRDPGAAPDRRRQRSASSADCCTRPRPASRVRSRRPPVPPLLLSHNLPHQSDVCELAAAPPREVVPERRKCRGRGGRRPRPRRVRSLVSPRLPPPTTSYNYMRQTTASANKARQANFAVRDCRTATDRKRISDFKNALPEANRDQKEIVEPNKKKNQWTQTKFQPQGSGLTSTPPPFGSSRAVMDIPSKARKSRARRIEGVNNASVASTQLFPDELVEMIAAGEEKRLVCLYRSPRQGESRSSLRLAPDPPQHLHRKLKKNPWR